MDLPEHFKYLKDKETERVNCVVCGKYVPLCKYRMVSGLETCLSCLRDIEEDDEGGSTFRDELYDAHKGRW